MSTRGLLPVILPSLLLVAVIRYLAIQRIQGMTGDVYGGNTVAFPYKHPLTKATTLIMLFSHCRRGGLIRGRQLY